MPALNDDPFAIWYYEPETTWHDTVRKHAAALCITALCSLEKLYPYRYLDRIRWAVEEVFEELFGAWHEQSPEALDLALQGGIPLQGIDQWTRDHIVDFDDVECACHKCDYVFPAGDSISDLCPLCYSDAVYPLTSKADWEFHINRARDRRMAGGLAPRPMLLLTERRAA